MGIFGRIFGIFRRKKREIPPEEIPPVPEPIPAVGAAEAQKITLENIKARLDLVIAELDSVKTQNQAINERLKTIEKILTEMRGIKYY